MYPKKGEDFVMFGTQVGDAFKDIYVSFSRWLETLQNRGSGERSGNSMKDSGDLS